ncbi:MAG: bifunctional (p)ppGpp synthetase/guanosine-3',5'-bis(diphosphate) 3'-pyrophosphohydrolase [Oscillospiraceae bacterium]|nr:bifunctional (p)ppGpp synthetase/guanosine-3',5'-bis(diphosphate) 3'-pyrophosphohydrolase [Oscillospiraceae bacterium]
MLEAEILDVFASLRKTMRQCCWPESGKKAFRPSDIEAAERAFIFAAEHHGAQMRESGEPYIAHPVAVAEILLTLGMFDRSSVLAALLHDILEDTKATPADIRAQFGQVVLKLVDGLTKLERLPFAIPEDTTPPELRREEDRDRREETQAQNILKMLLAMNRDPRVIIVKLADRLHNMRTLQGKKSEARKREIARETLKLYVPIADMLGIRLFKEELEDLAFRFVDPFGYEEVVEMLRSERQARENALRRIQERLTGYLGERFPARQLAPDDLHKGLFIEGRVKSVRGIYRKVHELGKRFEDIYDIYAVRVIVDTKEDCWTVFGLIQEIYHPLPDRYKNYISTPKSNGYQSLHITVRGEDGVPFEVQIRTWEMHEQAEYGLAAHWKYKQGEHRKRTGLEKQLDWVRDLLEGFRDSESAEEVMQTLQTDYALPDKIYVYSPKGQVYELPRGATVVDFAYAVHTEIGHCMQGAMVNNHLVSLERELQMGDTIKITTTDDKERGPNREWLRLAKTTRAQNKIRNWFKVMRHPENIREGKAFVEKELPRNFLRLEPEDAELILQKVISRKEQYAALDDFYAAIGYGGDTLQRYLPRLKEEYHQLIKERTQAEKGPEISKKRISDKGVIVEGISNCMLHFAQCCHPLPGDAIIGYITRGSGLAIHRRGCVNVPAEPTLSPEPDRWLPAHWEQTEQQHYVGSLSIRSVDVTGMLATLSAFFSSNHVDITAWQMSTHPDKTATILAGVTVSSREHLNGVVERLRKLKGVIEVRY